MNGNIFNNDDLSVGVIYEENLGNKNLKFKLMMNDKNIELDNGLLSVYSFRPHKNIPENIHLDLNELWDGEFLFPFSLNDIVFYISLFFPVDSEYVLSPRLSSFSPSFTHGE